MAHSRSDTVTDVLNLTENKEKPFENRFTMYYCVLGALGSLGYEILIFRVLQVINTLYKVQDQIV